MDLIRKMIPALVMCTLFFQVGCVLARNNDMINFVGEKTTIVVAKNAPESVKFAANELCHFLKKSTGQSYELAFDSEIIEPVKGKLILVGKSSFTEKLNLPKTFTADSFVIKAFSPNKLVLIGDDSRKGKPRIFQFDYISAGKGSLYAVYTLLEKYLGARWFWPGESGEIIPKHAALNVPVKLNYSSKPSFIWRHAWYYSYGKTPKGNREIALWYMRNKMGISDGDSGSFRHCWGRTLTDKYFKTNPEYYSLIDGKRMPTGKYRQFCSSNPAVVDIFAKHLIKNSKPDMHNIRSISPNDGNGFCECRKCKKLDHQKLYSAEQGLDGIVYSDRVYTFVNQVAEKIKKERPKLRLGLFAYTYYRDPPATIDRLSDNVVIALTQINGFFNYQGMRKSARNKLAAWAKKCGQIVIRDYLGDYHYCEVVHPYTKIIAEDLKYLHKHGACGFYWESSVDFMTNHLNYYVAARLLWDVNLSREDILKDYYQKAYGNAASLMREYFDLMEHDFTTREKRTKVMWSAAAVPSFYRKGTLAKAKAILEKAKAAVRNPDCLKRIAYDQKGLKYTKLVCDFFSACQRLTDIGLVVRIKNYVQKASGQKPTQAIIQERVEKAVIAKRELLEFIKKTNPGSLISMLPHQDRTFKWFDTVDSYEKMFLDGNKDRGSVSLMPAEWKFKTDPAKTGKANGWQKSDFDDSAWKTIKTDNFWEKLGYPDYDGEAWYRISHKISIDPDKEKIILRLGAVDENCDVYINGRLVGRHVFDAAKDPDGWKKPVEFDISKFIIPGKENSFAIKVTDMSGGGGLWKNVFLKKIPVAQK